MTKQKVDIFHCKAQR